MSESEPSDVVELAPLEPEPGNVEACPEPPVEEGSPAALEWLAVLVPCDWLVTAPLEVDGPELALPLDEVACAPLVPVLAEWLEDASSAVSPSVVMGESADPSAQPTATRAE